MNWVESVRSYVHRAWEHHPRLVPCVAICLTVLLPNWRLALGLDIVVTDDKLLSDIANGEFPMRVEIARQYLAGNFSGWTPVIFGGYDFSALGADPYTLAFFCAFPPRFACNYFLLTALCVLACGMYFLLREHGLSIAASMFAAVVLPWSGGVVCKLKHLVIVATFSYVPWCALVILKLVREADAQKRLRWAAGLALLIGAQWLAAFPQTAYYAHFFYLTVALSVLGRLPRPAQMRSVGLLVLAVGLGVVIGAAALLPLRHVGAMSDRAADSWEFATQHRMAFQDLATFVLPYVNGDVSNNTYRAAGIPWENHCYMGLIPLALFLVALVNRVGRSKNQTPRQPNDPSLMPWLLFLSFAIVVMLGSTTPLFRILFHVIPGMSVFRAQQRMLPFVQIAILFIGAIAIDRVRIRWPMLIRLAPLWIVLAWLDPMMQNFRQNGFGDSDLWLREPTTAALIKRDHPAPRIFSVGAHQDHEQAFDAGGWRSTHRLAALVPALAPCMNAHWNIAQLGGYSGLAPWWSLRMLGPYEMLDSMWRSVESGGLAPAAWFRTLRQQGVTHLVSARALEQHQEWLEPLGSASGYHMYRVRDQQPMFFGPAFETPDPIRYLHTLAATPFDFIGLADQQALTRDPAVEAIEVEGESIQMHRSSVDVIAARVQSAGRYLFWPSTYTQDWHAYVDGRETIIRRANIRGMAVHVPRGRHEVEFRYLPTFLHQARWVTLAGLLLTLLLYRLGGLAFIRKQS